MRASISTNNFPFLIVAVAAISLGSLSFIGSASAQSADSASMLASIAGDHKIASPVERMELIVKTSRILSLGDRIPRFQVHNEEVLGATPVSENQIQIFAKNPGTTQVNLWDTEDKLYTIDVTIVADAREVEGILNSQLPLASLKVMPINESAIVSGYVTSVDDVDRAVAIIEQFYKVVINNIEVVGVQQVLLHTKIMEVSRTKLRQLGIDWSLNETNFALLNGPSELLNVPAGLQEGANNALGFTPFGGATNLRVAIGGEFEAFVEALDEQKLVKLLAEPTVVATHGRPARFTVGGRVPNVIPGANGQLQVTYEDYGTSIDFLPFVVGPGRIRLEVRPEVSEPDPSRSVTINNTNVSAFTARYVETAVEMQAGQTFALAGLLQTRVDSIVKRTPFFGHLPYIGAFFRNVQDQHNEIELLIMVTPELVDAMDPYEVPRGGPGTNSDIPDEHEFYFNGHIEVPNLKGDDCHQSGGECYPADVAPHGESMIYEDATILPGGLGKNVSKPSATTPISNRQASRVASVPQENQPQQRSIKPTYPRSRVESGTLLPASAVMPGAMPAVVGEGVTVMQPKY
ncbi:type II and III secretion system protein family protein [Neorhodopirellula pilleata]|uniref:Type II secretion system protein D n=1 Tax=Neorhodopirellula pilleata TaxID=2714738 RepID=A0A5C6AVQ7_9BACT|nr:pilus assembly protein N-terminal domain-containing protein [Neorhodopirellula pilleata]TWU03567.1 Type II secretion system protein D precursor [Neorhodopirellula pilleata]